MSDDVQPVIGPYREPKVACLAPDPRAGDVARQVSGLISEHLPSLRPEHVGSTAVPGCAGRGIIDLLLPVAEGDLESAGVLLARLGFQQGAEAVFPSYPPPFRGTWIENGNPFLIHVHLLPTKAPEVDSIRFFRSCLRSDPDLAKAYVAQKRAIIKAGVAEPVEYCRQKGEFLKMVLG